MIAVVTYGVSNVGSMFNMLEKIGVPATAASTPDEIARADKIILPGVGAFDHGMSTLVERGLAEALKKRVLRDGIPLLGVCLGMQLLGRGSEEGVLDGLGLVEGRCVRLRSESNSLLKVPHMGWNVLAQSRESPLFDQLDARARFYFVHSYHLVCADSADVLATARYGVEFTAMVQRANVWGAQFHPEKSHRYGMTLLRNFARL
jgi:glutamine amidotransferase